VTTQRRAEFDRLVKEIEMLQNRAELTADAYLSFQSSVLSLVQQKATDALVEESRDKACIYYETYLDLQIQIGKLTGQLDEYTK
jgi:hypothetical protein